MVVTQRNAWVEDFKAGKRPALLLTYEKIRNSELERLSTQVEKLAEYALYLEYKLSNNPELILCSVCNQSATEPHYKCANFANNWIDIVYKNWKNG